MTALNLSLNPTLDGDSGLCSRTVGVVPPASDELLWLRNSDFQVTSGEVIRMLSFVLTLHCDFSCRFSVRPSL